MVIATTSNAGDSAINNSAEKILSPTPMAET
jgi:hypothetical protein